MPARPTARTLELPGLPDAPETTREVRISSPDRIIWPEHDGQPAITKGDLADYTATLGDTLLRHIGGRPVTLQRFPDGIEGEEFYQKNPPKGMPDWINVVRCRYPSGRRHDQIVIDEIAAAVWTIQMNTVTWHPWPVKRATDSTTTPTKTPEASDNPDELRIDLDPQPGRGFKDAVSAAYILKDLLNELGLTGWAKTSGNRGVHVYARIEPTHEFLDVRHAVIGIARELERRATELVTSSWWKEERGERVFVDFNQACRDRTIASAYSPRPLPGAPVSMPVRWDDLRDVDPRDFTVLTVPTLLESYADAWLDLDAHPGRIEAALGLWEADLERGLGELNFPPDYPKMPGEPPRVQPSKRRTDKDDADYLAPKADRDEEHRRLWGMPVVPPVPPMLAKPVAGLDAKPIKDLEAKDSGGGVLFEPKWDGFRSIIFRSGDQVEIGSRNEKPLTRYFPELVEAILENFPAKAVIDGEIIVERPGGDRLDFDLLSQRIHPAASRIKKLAEQTPARFVAFDILALGEEDLTTTPFAQRRERLEEALVDAKAPIHVTPVTRDKDVAESWFTQFEGAGLDGIMAKPADGAYEPNKRTMFKIKHERTADCVVAGYREHKSGPDAVGSLLLGLYDDDGNLASVGVIGAFPMAIRQALVEELKPLVAEWDEHPWAWARQEEGKRTPQASAGSRWAAGKDLSFIPLRPERVVEVRYDHMEGVRFRHTAQFVRWREDKDPRECTYDQLEEPVSYDLGDVLDGTV